MKALSVKCGKPDAFTHQVLFVRLGEARQLYLYSAFQTRR